MTERDLEKNHLDVYFDALREESAAPSGRLISRIMSDANQVQAGFSAPRPLVASPPGFFRQLADALGGWPAMAGLATAACTGVWLGISPPSILFQTTDGFQTVGDEAELFDPSPDIAFDFGEEA